MEDARSFPGGTVTFLFTDVVESSRLWEEHHDDMARAMARHDEEARAIVADASGHYLKSTGDGVFAVFSSAFDAVAAAAALHSAAAGWSVGTIPELSLRVGLHTGEAQLRDGDYFGSTVNRAARLMGTARGGEILLSASTHEVVRDRLPAGLVIEDAGDQPLRGMSRPEHAYVLRVTQDYPVSMQEDEAVENRLPEEARRAAWIAVLPFDNMGGDPEQDYFADGISEDVITGLAAYRSLRVISRTSSFRYRRAQQSVSQIADELGVRFLLEGSVRRAGSRVRVTAQLIEAAREQHIWADRYDGDIVDIFDVQDAIARSIVVAIHPAIRSVDAGRVGRARPDNLDAWDHVQRGWSEHFKNKKAASRTAIEHFTAAIALDEHYADAWAGLSTARSISAWLLWDDEPKEMLAQARDEAKRAIALDPRDATAHTALAISLYGLGRLGPAVRAAEEAIELNPSIPYGYLFGGVSKIHGGDPAGGVPMIDTAVALSPRDPMANFSYGGRAIGHYLLGDFDAAVADARAGIGLRYGYLFGRVVLTAALVGLGRLDEARDEARTIIETDPAFDLSKLDLYTFPDAARAQLQQALRSAGIPD